MKIWNSPAGTIKLKRYPFAGERSHQAWDAADEWIVSRFPVHNEPIIIMGEAFGALGTAWGGTEVSAAGDSFMSFEALRENRRLNNIGADTLKIIKTTDPLPDSGIHFSYKRIFIRLPKSLELLEIFIRMMVPYADTDTEIWLGGMEKRWSRGTSATAEKYLTAVEVHPFERHARWIQYKKTPDAGTIQGGKITEKTDLKAWGLEHYPLSICPAPSVFSNASLDPGTSAFLEAFPEAAAKDAGRITDIGCGSGILGLCAAFLNPGASITFTDESYLAVESARTNLEHNKLSSPADFLVTNGADGIADSSQDLVLCNPPFHHQNIQTREPAAFLFSEALRILKPGGTIQIVGNSHLGYHKLLKDYFPDAREAFRNSRFTVLCGRKPY